MPISDDTDDWEARNEMENQREELLAELQSVKAKLAAAEQRLAVSWELIRSALVGYKVLRNLCKNADLIAGYEASVDWIADFESFLSNAPDSEWVVVRREDLEKIVIPEKNLLAQEAGVLIDWSIDKIDKWHEAYNRLRSTLEPKGGRDGE